MRTPQNDDFCFLTLMDSMFGTMFENILKAENIPCAAIPVGNGVRSCFGLKLEHVKIYAPFEFLLNARQLLGEMQNNFEEELNSELIKNVDKLHTANNRSEKKLKKNLKLVADENLVTYCSDKIIIADKIADKEKNKLLYKRRQLLVRL